MNIFLDGHKLQRLWLLAAKGSFMAISIWTFKQPWGEETNKQSFC